MTEAQKGRRTVVVYDVQLGEKRIQHFLASQLGDLDLWVAMTMSAGEGSKSLEQVSLIWDTLAEAGMTRNDLVVGIGGGTITDVVAFAASTFKRGVPCLLAPTTVVAMVDAAHGGKTAINWHGAKNQIGTYSPAETIVSDTAWLATLPPLEILSGWMEMVKHALIGPGGQWDSMKTVPTVNLEAVSERIAASAEIKRRIVLQDMHEKGPRKQLNLGHTTGHAIESWSQTQLNPIPHGIAVGWGMIASLHWSVALAGADASWAEAVASVIAGWLPPCPPCKAKELWPWMLHDKKNSAEVVRVVCIREIGQLTWDIPLDFDRFEKSWQKTEATCGEKAGIHP